MTQTKPFVRMAIGSTILLLLGLLFVRFIQKSEPVELRSDRVNLALRRTADRLLRAAGDSTSRIDAVVQTAPHIYRVRFGRSFDYDQLPALLQESFSVHKIDRPYDVAILDCATKTLQLGYTIADLTGPLPVACQGRDLESGCYVLQVTFAPVQSASGSEWPFLALGGLLSCVLALVWYRAGQRPQPNPPAESSPVETDPAPTNPNLLVFGQSCLDLTRQTLVTGPTTHTLTYREAKLLRVLVQHANEVLERDRILQLVWADEGVTVGRSVDVFISRLRKLLADDPAVRIATLHGVGYRLEVD